MAILLITGTPGAGKTLRAIQLGVQAKKEGMKVFHVGIDDMDPRLIPECPGGFEKWKDLPKGSTLIVDEAHKFLPVRQPGRPPQWIQDLTEIRHFGIKLILVTQDPRNLDAFVRRLIGEHEHVSRKMGMGAAQIRTFQGVAENPGDFHAQKGTTTKAWSYPKDLFSAYTSSTMHLVKRKIPWKMFACVLVILALPVAFYFVFQKVPGIGNGAVSSSPSSPSAVASASSSAKKLPGDKPDPWASREAFLHEVTPLIPGIPWSAPLYRNSRAAAPPRLACIEIGSEGALTSSGPGSKCRCFTEQATPVPVTPLLCRKIAHEGIYHPFAPAPAQNGLQGQTSEAESAKPAVPTPGKLSKV